MILKWNLKDQSVFLRDQMLHLVEELQIDGASLGQEQLVDVICDTSFLIHLATRKIKNLDSIYTEIGNIEFVVPLVVLNELEQLTKNQDKQHDASKTLEFVRDMKNIEILGKFADNAISEYIQKHGGMVATMDEGLKNKIKNLKGTIISFSNDKIVLESQQNLTEE